MRGVGVFSCHSSIEQGVSYLDATIQWQEKLATANVISVK
jgi:hypothetical protein